MSICNSMAFTYECGHLAVATSKGLYLVDCRDELVRPIGPEFRGGGPRLVDVLHDYEYVVFTGDGGDSRFPPNKAVIWDERRRMIFAEIKTDSPVTAVKLSPAHLLVATETKIRVYSIRDKKLLLEIETALNTEGIVALSKNEQNPLVAFPRRQSGTVSVADIRRLAILCVISAHKTGIRKLSFDASAEIIATASERGTLIRLFESRTGIGLRELRRGSLGSRIDDISFSPDSLRVCVVGERGSATTVHLFTVGDDTVSNKRSPLYTMALKNYLPKHQRSEWSFVRYRLDGIAAICAIGGPGDGAVFVASRTGEFWRFNIDREGEGEERTMRRNPVFEFMKTLHISDPSPVDLSAPQHHRSEVAEAPEWDDD
eukprot:Opistho-2@32558